ncbi:MAG TPA: LuxR C-terminal-related transcriptional regulator [Acidimicrobiales bacterium]|nr:LuxR C-terminal-related transcriptional regulator [Acidimicrobiales bacterium]
MSEDGSPSETYDQLFERASDAHFGLPVVSSKLVMPQLPNTFVARPRVLSSLSRAPWNFCLLQAPAGYGKTIAAIEIVKSMTNFEVAWLSLDQFDSAELGFWVHLAASIDRAHRGLLRGLSNSPSWRPKHGGAQLAASLLGAISSESHLVIVLDDLHHIRSRAVWDQLSFFLDRLPNSVVVLATSRALPPLPIERWTIQQKALTVDERILRFDTSETSELVSHLGHSDLGPDDIVDLVERSEGWAVGLILETLTRDRPCQSETVKNRRRDGPTRAVVSYLTTEVLDGMSAEDREFLLSLSVLDTFDNDLCRKVTGERDAGLRLRSLQIANLFMMPVDELAGRFRLHHSLREMLLEELDSRDPGRVVELQRNAAAAAEARGEVMLQIHHLVQAGEHAEAVQLMIAYAFRQGSLATARELIESFPEQFLHEDPTRMLDIALMHFFAGNWTMAKRWCDQVASTLEAGPSPLRARLELYRTWTHGGVGDGESAARSLNRSLAAGICNDEALVALAILTVVRLHILFTNDKEAAAAWLDKAAHVPAEFVHTHSIAIPALTAALEFSRGEPRRAETLARRALAAADELEAPPAPPVLEALLALTDVLIESGRLSDAAIMVQQAEELASQVAPLAYTAHIELRRIELEAATRGAAAGAFAADRAVARLNQRGLATTLSDRLIGRHAYWLLKSGDVRGAKRNYLTLRPSPTRCIIEALLHCHDDSSNATDHTNRAFSSFVDTKYWSFAQRLEIELIHSATNGYSNVCDIVDHADGLAWTVVRQGEPLLRRLASEADRTKRSTIVDLMERSHQFSAAFRPTDAATRGLLTDRERALLDLLPSCLTYSEMASELSISVNTVKSNLKALYRKLGASTRSEAVRRATAAELLGS